MDVDAGQTVEYVRAYIHEHFGVPFAGSILTFEGRTLIDPMSLCDFGVTVATLPRHTMSLLAAGTLACAVELTRTLSAARALQTCCMSTGANRLHLLL